MDYPFESSYNFDMKDPKAERLIQQFFPKERTELANHNDKVKSVTVMKYLGADDNYYFIVLDKFDIADEIERFDYMIFLKYKMLKSGEMKKHLWTKQTVLF